MRTLERGLQVLELFQKPRQEHTVNDIARHLDIQLPTAYRLVNTLLAKGYLERQGARGPLRLGLSLLQLGWNVQAGLEIREAARPVMERLVATAGETAALMVPSADAAVCVDNIEGTSPIRPASLQVAQRVSFNAGALPLAILAHLDEARLEQVLATPAPALTPRTLTAPDALRERCRRIRQDGYAYSEGEAIVGSAAAAAPIFGAGDVLLGALGVTGIASRMAGLEQLVTTAAGEVSAAMGYQPRT